MYNAFLLAYTAQQLRLDSNTVLVGLMAAGGLGIFVVPITGVLSDRIGRRPVYMGAAAFAGLFAFPSFWLIDTGVAPLIWLATVLMWGVAACGMYGPLASFFSELFDPRSRYSGISFVYQVGAGRCHGVACMVRWFLVRRRLCGGHSPSGRSVPVLLTRDLPDHYLRQTRARARRLGVSGAQCEQPVCGDESPDAEKIHPRLALLARLLGALRP